MIGVKKKNFIKRKLKEIVFSNSILRIEKVLKEESCHGVGAMMCSSLYYCQHFPCQMTRWLRHKFQNKSFEEKCTHTLDIPRRLHQRRDCNCAKFVMLQKRDVCKKIWYKIMGISRSTYMSYKQECKKGVGFYHIEIRGVKKVSSNDTS